MKKKRTKRPCINCEREMLITGQGLCGGCYEVAKNKSGEEREKALAAAKVRLAGWKPIDVPRSESAQSSSIKAGMTSLNLVFANEDQKILERLRIAAKSERRTAEQQVLWILEKNLL